ncbi:hypothetical protein [Mycobacteroides abscessus]|uniref:hypothetical protein n=1 Tax=Mycobacteroides abscessus TaxID=36809 RepID=UPI0021044F75|nr:hypothetical protein [Mycobacteroides abscessus]
MSNASAAQHAEHVDDNADDYHSKETIRYELPADAAQFVTYCDRHQRRGLAYPTAREAYDKFVCDPLGQQFLIASRGEYVRVTDLGGLRAAVRSALELAPLVDEEMPQLFRWTATAPHLEPLTHSLVHAGKYNEDGLATSTYRITTATGQTIIEFNVTIDGNA